MVKEISAPIRVLHIVTYMGRGGLETMLMNYYRRIDRTKVQFDFLVHRKERADYDAEIESLGGRIFRVSRLIPWSRKYKNELRDFFTSHPEYKIVHVHQDCLSSVALKAAKRSGIPVRIAHSHNVNQDKNLKYYIKLFYKKFIPEYSTCLFACGKDAGDWMFGGSEYRILNNAIDADEFTFKPVTRNNARRELGLANEFVVGLTARFAPQKNHSFLLDIFAALYKTEPDAKLLLVGDGDLRGEIEEKIRSLGIAERVILTGVRSDIAPMLSAMDVFVMPSHYEGLSLAIVEAQAAGLPCFISDGVPIECKKTDLVTQLSLADAPETWAQAISESRTVKRRNTCNEIVQAGFDIKNNARWLENFYMQKAEEANAYPNSIHPCL